MPDMDDLLQEKLEAIEKGSPIEDVLGSLPLEAQELTSLLFLAQAVRVLPHPELSQAQAQVGEQKVLAAAQSHNPPLPEKGAVEQPQPQVHPQPEVPTAGSNGAGPRPVEKPPAKRQTRWIFPRFSMPAVAGLASALVIFLVVVVGAGLWLSGPSGAKAATLMDVTGYVEVQADDGAWTVAKEGQQVHAGQSVRTSGASGATLLFYEGSRTTLGPNTSLTLETVSGQWGKALQVEIAQASGKTSHSVVPLQGKDSAYRVDAPGGTASVHGTRFSVAVAKSGQSLFAVRTGKVEVSNNQSQVFVTAGQVTAAEPGKVAEAPAYQFVLEGTLAGVDGDTWTVGSALFSASLDTIITGKPVLGDDVHVEGRILDTGVWFADLVERVDISEPSTTFSGPVQSTGLDSWQVGGQTLVIDSQTQIGPRLLVGDVVQVTFRVQGDQWTALSITSLDETVNEEPLSLPEPVAGAKPALEFSPEEVEIPSCETSFVVQGSLFNNGEEPDDVAANVKLGYTIDMGAEFVDTVEFDPSAWETIDAGAGVPFTVTMDLDRAAWDAAAGKKVVKLRVFVAQETNRPDHLKAKMTITIDGGDCQPTETPEPQDTEEPTVEPSETVEPTQPAETLEGVCTGTQQHPTGLKLAQRYGVSYEEIMGWFCTYNLGFGEIDEGYSLSLQTGIPVADVFSMRLSGMGWGEIKQALLDKKNPKLNEEPTEKPAREKPTKKPKPSKP